MARRMTFDCDQCPGKDIGDKAWISVYEPRQPGEMDGGSIEVWLCHRCSLRLVMALVKRLDLTHAELSKVMVPLRLTAKTAAD